MVPNDSMRLGLKQGPWPWRRVIHKFNGPDEKKHANLGLLSKPTDKKSVFFSYKKERKKELFQKKKRV